MPEIKKVFLRGKMNQDLDERLIPDGEYRDASNIQVSSTEGNDAGTVQNILGNRKESTYGLGGKCIGIIENTETEKIYLFIKGTNVDAIIEYNETDRTSKPVLVENKSRSNPVLNFTDEKLTGITILEDFLIFTDNSSEPKIIDISNDSIFIAGSTNFTTTTQINGVNFIESDVTVIKKSPLNAPGVSFDISWGTGNFSVFRPALAVHRERFVRFAYRWKFNNGQYSTYSPFTDPVFIPAATQSYDTSEGFNNDMYNHLTSIKLVNIEHGKNISGNEEIVNDIKSIDILYKESNNTNVYLYKTVKYEDIVNKWETGIDVSKESKKSVIPDDQLFRAFDNVPHKAKAVDVVGSRIVFGNYEDGLNLDDYNPEFNITLKDRGNLNAETTRQYLNAAGDGAVNATTSTQKDTATVKSGREYQIGVVFQDEYGRKSPVLTNETGYKKIQYHTGKLDAIANDPEYGKKFNVKNTNEKPPDPRIKKFRYYIKSSTNEYNNIIVQEAKFDGEDPETLWLVVSSYEINKVKEGDYLLLKKGKNTQTPLNSANIFNPNETIYHEEDFKVKILAISNEKPTNIESALNYDGKFFIKIKRNAKVTTHLHNISGIAGINGTIPEDKFKKVEAEEDNPLALVIGGVFLGEVKLDYGSGFYQMKKYYFKDGEIIYNLGIPLSPSVFPNIPPNTFTNSNFSPTGSVGSFVDLANVANAATTAAKDLASTPFVDITGQVNKIEVKYNADAFPTDFKITYVGSSGSAAEASPAIFETVPEGEVLDVYYETTKAYDIDQWTNSQGFDLSFHNAFTMRNGVESNLIGDDFNEDRVGNGVKVSTIINNEYNERIKETSLIYSGIFNDETDVNELNEFNTSLKITKELNPEYGSIQKLHTRNTDLIALCEDKILRILANKDALFNADGNVNLVSNKNVLGQAVAYNGDYGISKNPESFANHGYRSYFTDKARGAVIRLSKDGLTVISDKGMSSYFREKLLAENNDIIGSYDIYSDQYILTLPTENTSISFKEDVDGWVSRLDFIPDGGVSLNGNYYTCYLGELYRHHSNLNRNVFYGLEKTSGIKLIFNQEASTIKNFKNLSYEGTTGWNVGSEEIITDQQKGQILEFKEKEGKYFGLISGIEEDIDTISASEQEDVIKDFSVQGLGNISSHSGTITFGCANAGLNINSGVVGATVTGTVALGTIQSISPSTYQTGTNIYTATILAPSGFDNSGSTITCSASAGATNAAFTCTDANLQIPNGTIGATVSGTVAAGTIASYSPTTYQSGTNTYSAVINIPSGYSNSGTLTCTDTATGSAGSCAFSLGVTTYNASAGTTQLTGTFSGTDYTNSDAIALTVSSGTISPTTTTKSALASGLTVTLSEGVTITAKITSGLCNNTSATIQAPQAATVVINGSGTAFTYDNITLTASTTGTVTSYQWYKGTSSGFTTNSSSLITGATNATLTTQETSAATKYYKVKINGSTDSAAHAVVYSNRPSFTLKFIAGSSITQGACSSSTTKTIFANNSSFTAATEFYKNVQGSTTGFDGGTYSNSTNGSNNHHRFISSGGVPSSAVSCSSGNQGIRASKCNNSSFDRYFNVDLDGGGTLSNGNVISFTTQQENNDYWYVEDAAYSGTNFDASPTLASTHSSCTLMLTPVVNVAASASSSFIYSATNLVTRTLSLTTSNVPQGATLSYQWQGGTAANNLSNISGATSATLDVNFNTVSNSAGSTTYYNCNVTFTDGSDSKTINATTSASITWNNFTTYTNLNYVNGGSSTTPSVSACTATSDQRTLYGNAPNLAQVTQFFSNATGATGGISTGTYSDGSKRAYVNGGNGQVISTWQECTTFEITGATQGSSYATVILTAQETGFAGTNFAWSTGGSVVQSGSSNTYAASVANNFSGNVTYGCTVSGGTANNQNDTHTITWSVPEQKVQAQLCPNGAVRDIRITNADGYQVGEVVELNSDGSLPAGCYKITNANFTGNQQYSTTVVGSYPFSPYSDCCDCTGCSVSVSGTTSKPVNQTTTLTASASGFSPTGYQWQSSTDDSNFTNISGETSATIDVTSSSGGFIYYRVIATASGISETSASHFIFWQANVSVERFYNAQALQSDCTDDDEVITVRYTSINALSNGTIFELGTTTVTCYEITGTTTGNQSNSEIVTFHNSCTACQTANSADCSFSLSTQGNYNSSAGTQVVKGTFGSGHTATSSIGFTVSSGTVSPTSATKSQLISGVTLTLSAGVTLTGTINSTDPCTGDIAQVSIPQASCNSVQAFSTTSNPETDEDAANDLCGGGTARTLYINGTTLANSTQVYTAAGCGTLMSGTKYYSTDEQYYHIWNGYSLSQAYLIDCP